ncbi:MAG: preprotein translocase subunit SecA, partial [Alphaproteobacteria bacterium]|nr:preprotein translocase subunit SecA [Alphaproteobacteria bacterium]
MIEKIIMKIMGSANDRLVKSHAKTVSLINDLEEKYHAMTDDELRACAAEFRAKLAAGAHESEILADAFAAVREASIRTTGMRHFDVQMVGGMVLNNGQITEMKTGEGKTLVATLALFLKALHGKGAHLVTVNDYLAKRDAEWMGVIYEKLGLSVGIIQHAMNDDERRAAYACDITYVTNSELGFDYLRDNMKFSADQLVLRPFFYCIVDEVDSILIDEARTPLIISGPAEDTSELYYQIDDIVKQFTETDFVKNEKDRHVTLTESGTDTATRLLSEAGLLVGDNLYLPENARLVMHVQQALMANNLFKREVNYVVRGGEVLLVDEFTGRVMTGRRFSKGLHQALEAKERVKILPENQTVSSISYQNLFRMFPTLAGMTGTAMTEAAEFEEIYNLRVVSVPTNRPVARVDHQDEIYRNKEEKFAAILTQVKECMDRGQPVLIGTVSIEKSEELADIVRKELKIEPAVLNAKHHENEAYIVAQAGVTGAVTIATNMAGRGTDIKLGGNTDKLLTELNEQLANSKEQLSEKEIEKRKKEIWDRVEADKVNVLNAGGLYVIGTERHESRRIDNQLRGRSGRQGDPGDSKFFLSLDDDLMRIFGAARLEGMLSSLGLKPGEAITHPWITKALEKAQKRVEARHFEARKELLKYDDVMNDQRKEAYKIRHELMTDENLEPFLMDIMGDIVENIAETNIPEKAHKEDWNLTGINDAMKQTFGVDITDLETWRTNPDITEQKAFEGLMGVARSRYDFQVNRYGKDMMDRAIRQTSLHALDTIWRKHLAAMEALQTGIGLRGYAQKNPLYEYKREAFEMFRSSMHNFKSMALAYVCRLELNMDEINAMKKQQAERDAELNNPNHTAMPFAPAGKSAIGRNDNCPCASGKKY